MITTNDLTAPRLKIDRYVYLDGCTFDRLDLAVYRNNELVDLTFIQLKILNFLCRRPGDIHSCEDIAVAIGNTSRSIRVHIHRMKTEKHLRRAIETIHTAGYRAVPIDVDLWPTVDTIRDLGL